jgi:HEAT repeat protein
MLRFFGASLTLRVGVGMGLSLIALGVMLAPSSGIGGEYDPEQFKADLGALRTAGLDTDGPGLVTFFKKRTLSEADRKRVAELIGKLGADTFADREKATRELIKLGTVARPQLQEATRSTDLEVRRRARRCLGAISSRAEKPELLSAAIRVLGARNPAGAVETLLNYLPNIEDASVVDEVGQVLGTIGIKGGKPDPALLSALGDKMVVKRIIAGEVLARVGGKEQRERVRKLLKDEEIRVRRRVALALVTARDKEAVPALIALLADRDGDDDGQIESLLESLAGEKSPPAPSTRDDEGRRNYARAWERWWKANGAGIDLAKVNLDEPLRGHTLIAEWPYRKGGTYKVFELDKGGKLRWKIESLSQPVSAQMVGRNRVLICEYGSTQLTERTTKGEIVWRKAVPYGTLSARRLRNGNTFIATRNRLVEVDKAGKEVKAYSRPVSDIMAADRAADGETGFVTSGSVFVRLDRAGKQIKSFSVGPGRVYSYGSTLQLLPKGHILVVFYTNGVVIEYDADGKSVWQASLLRPIAARRLPNGHTLVSTNFGQRMVELDKAGKEVSSYNSAGRILFMDRR